MNYTKLTWCTLLLFFTIITAWGTTWAPVYPYTQQCEGQRVTIKAIPYDPHGPGPLMGVTSVFLDRKLLYTVDKYYHRPIFASDDGTYLAIINTTYYADIAPIGNEKINFNQTAIEVLKNGQPFRTFSISEVIDTTRPVNFGNDYYWGYYVDYEAFENARWGCKYCKQDNTRKELKECFTGADTSDYCKECVNQCDSAKTYKLEKFLRDNSIYVQNNSVFILTNQETVVKVDFVTFEIQQIPFNKIIPDKRSFHPPKVKVNYRKVNYPDKFAEPGLNDGRSFEKALADLFGLSISVDSIPVKRSDNKFCIFIDQLVIDQNGKCIYFYGKVYDERISEFFIKESVNSEMTEKLNQWVSEQTFRTNLIPRGFDAFSFLCIVHLK